MGVSFTPDQQKVIDLHNRNILVSAAAGSGKTAVLVERIIQMVCDESHPVDIDRLLHYLAMLHLSGTFKIWKPKPTVESEEKTITETEINGVTYNDGDKVDYFEGQS